MPRLSEFYGIVIYMYTREHGVAHFQARHGDDETVIDIATGTVLVGRAASSGPDTCKHGPSRQPVNRPDIERDSRAATPPLPLTRNGTH